MPRKARYSIIHITPKIGYQMNSTIMEKQVILNTQNAGLVITGGVLMVHSSAFYRFVIAIQATKPAAL